MQLPKTIFLDSAIFMEKKLWGINYGEKVKFGGKKESFQKNTDDLQPSRKISLLTFLIE
jgi:hypothetical protein